MLFCATKFDGINFWQLLSENTTVTFEAFRHFLDRYIQNWKNRHNCGRVLLAHDNAIPHVARLDYLKGNDIET